jgi:hypothetical protein
METTGFYSIRVRPMAPVGDFRRRLSHRRTYREIPRPRDPEGKVRVAGAIRVQPGEIRGLRREALSKGRRLPRLVFLRTDRADSSAHRGGQKA